MSDQNRKLFDELKSLVTEKSNPNSESIDTASVKEILEIINNEDSKIHSAVQLELSYIEQAVDIVVHAFKNNGRLFYVGAGTSGRLGVLDASECPPTFGSEPDMVHGIIAGGDFALRNSIEGAEDERDGAIAELEKLGFNSKDVLCGLTASNRTPFVLGALDYAKIVGAKTIFLACSPRDKMPFQADVNICPVVGPEVVMGSTRMKSGTAEKLVLNMLTTASFIRMGKTYGNMMIDLQMKCDKLIERSKRVVMMVTGLDYENAGKVLEEADGHVKTAIFMTLSDTNKEMSTKILDDANGFVRVALENFKKEK